MDIGTEPTRRRPGSSNQSELDQSVEDLTTLRNLILPPPASLPKYTDTGDPHEFFVSEAQKLRACLEHRVQKPCNVCAVCARYLPLVTKEAGPASQQVRWTEVPVREITNLHLLRSDGPKTEEMPRVALTTVSVDGILRFLS